MSSIRRHKATGPVRFLPATVIAIGLGSIVVQAETIYETADPFGGPFGLIGFDVYEQQSVRRSTVSRRKTQKPLSPPQLQQKKTALPNTISGL